MNDLAVLVINELFLHIFTKYSLSLFELLSLYIICIFIYNLSLLFDLGIILINFKVSNASECSIF